MIFFRRDIGCSVRCVFDNLEKMTPHITQVVVTTPICENPVMPVRVQDSLTEVSSNSILKYV
jgi:hypothetical protein